MSVALIRGFESSFARKNKNRRRDTAERVTEIRGICTASLGEKEEQQRNRASKSQPRAVTIFSSGNRGECNRRERGEACGVRVRID